MMPALRPLAVLAVVAAPAWVASPAAALSCVGPSEWMPAADHVFVGRVADVRGETVRFAVTEVWQGTDLAPHVWLRRNTEMDMWYPFAVDGDVPDGLSSAAEYVVGVDDDLYLDVCDAWARDSGMDHGVRGERSPRAPVPGTEAGVEPDDPAVPVAAGAAGAVGALGLATVAGLLWRRRRS